MLQGIKRFEETKPEPATFFTIAQMLADFFAEVRLDPEPWIPKHVIAHAFPMLLPFDGI